MKNWLLYILILSVSLPSVLKVVYVTNFYLNRSTIARESCIQKEIPNNCCQGSCQLTKDLATISIDQTQSKSEQRAFPKLIPEDHWVSAISTLGKLKQNPCCCDKLSQHSINFQTSNGYFSLIDKPPRFS
jgi:hypothetical protein